MTVAADTEVREKCDTPGCIICNSIHAPVAAYRPHFMDSGCWCCFGVTGRTRVRSVCYLAKYADE